MFLFFAWNMESGSMAAQKSKQNYYFVQEGDTLWKIASRFGTTAEALGRANNIPKPYDIGPGQALVLPDDTDDDLPESVVGGSGSAQVGEEVYSNDAKQSAPPKRAARPRATRNIGDAAAAKTGIGFARGIDVSSYQPEVDWEKAAEAGVAFAFVRATTGESDVDGLFEEYWNGAREAGVLRGASHFMGIRPGMAAQRQAEHFIQTMQSAMDRGELPPVLDIEMETTKGIRPEEIAANVKTWLDAVEKEFGKKPIIYANAQFIKENFVQPDGAPLAWLKDYPLWLPQYGGASAAPTIPPGWNDWTFWQYTDKGTVSGVEGPAELDYFNGALGELQTFAAGRAYQRTNFMVNDRPEGPDLLDYERYVEAFVKILDGEYTQVPLTIGVYAAWGMGKSFLLGKIAERLKEVGRQKMKLGRAAQFALGRVRGLVAGHKKRIERDEKEMRAKSAWAVWRERRLARLERLAGRLEQSGEGSRFGFINFNAWVYSGSENLWAGLVTRLYDKIEEFYGPSLVQRHRLQRSLERVWKTFVKSLWLVLIFGLPALAVSWLEGAEMIQENWGAVGGAFRALSGASLLVNIPNIYKALRELVNSLVFARAQELANLSSRKDFKQQIGFMADVQAELREISKLIRESDRRRNQKTRFVIFVDDLDRCAPSKAVEVLEAIMLLLSDIPNDPFIIFLAIDARVIVKAIELRYGDMLTEAGVSGYEFLDKIVQIPFRIPPSNDANLIGYVDSMLWHSREAKKKFEQQEPKSRPLPFQPEGEDAPPSRRGQPAPGGGTFGGGGGPGAPTRPPVRKEAPKPAAEERPFDDDEKRAFDQFVPYLSRNPRRVKRIVNIYRLSRMLMPKEVVTPEMLVKWVILTEQWPFRAAWMMQQLNDDIQAGRNDSRQLTLPGLYERVRANVESEKSRALALLDEDADLFKLFIIAQPNIVGDDIYRRLQVITFNLNPAMESEVLKAALKTNDPAQGKKSQPAASRGPQET